MTPFPFCCFFSFSGSFCDVSGGFGISLVCQRCYTEKTFAAFPLPCPAFQDLHGVFDRIGAWRQIERTVKTEHEMPTETQPLRILQVMAGNKHGGAEIAFVDMCIAMAEAGQIVEVVTRANDGRVPRLEEAGLKVHTLPFGGAIDLYTPWAIGRIIKAFQPDIVQTWLSRGAWKTPKWKPGSGDKPYRTVARLGNYYKMKYFRTMEYFVAITPDIKSYIIGEGNPQDHVVHINNFAETEDAPVPVLRRDLETPDDATVLLGLGRLHDDKAFDTLIEAVGKMPEHVHLWIAGEGPDREKLESLIGRLGVSDRVKLLGWRDDRAALLQACDICTFTSRDEPFGTVFVQAWAQKTPVVVSDADGPRQFVRDGEDGLVTPIDDQDAIVRAIARLDGDPALKERLSQNGWARYQNEFTKEKTVQAYLDFYRKIISE